MSPLLMWLYHLGESKTKTLICFTALGMCTVYVFLAHIQVFHRDTPNVQTTSSVSGSQNFLRWHCSFPQTGQTNTTFSATGKRVSRTYLLPAGSRAEPCPKQQYCTILSSNHRILPSNQSIPVWWHQHDGITSMWHHHAGNTAAWCCCLGMGFPPPARWPAAGKAPPQKWGFLHHWWGKSDNPNQQSHVNFHWNKSSCPSVESALLFQYWIKRVLLGLLCSYLWTVTSFFTGSDFSVTV